ncbi:MAG: hypothetical protein QOF43_1853, partial [Gaiellaceae bacterium]|nr:hypothetical protein [Gaiellaceae bacterium]
FVDGGPYPTASDLIGTEVLRVPRGGAFMLWVRDPLHAVTIGVFAILLGVFSGGLPGSAGRGETASSRPRRRRLAPNQLQLIPAVALALLGGMWLIALGTPGTKTGLDAHLYTNHGQFSWAGTPKKGSVLADPVRTGDVVFARVVPRLRVGFDYLVSSAAPVRAGGTAQLVLDVSGDNGWHTVQRLGPERTLTGPHAHLTGILDLASLTRLAKAVDDETGVASTAYEVTLTPRIHLTGRAGESPLDTVYAPRLRFTFDTRRLVAAPSTAKEPNEVVAITDGAGIVTRPNAFHLGPASVGIRTMRDIGRVGTLLALIAFVAAFALSRMGRGHDEPAMIAWRYGDWLVPITHLPAAAGTVTDVSDFPALARLAERYNRAIMHLADGSQHAYYLTENGIVYRYRASEGTVLGHATPRPAQLPPPA